ncbi:hypothetical protein [Kitasatospora sp. NPDC088134]|uniref:hypothetical protein n=1 Tax=Kitasatospora sp. NPDC088134 TaxID=3364071 RepID=UPI0037F1A99B
MTISGGLPPKPNSPARLGIGLLTGGVVGASLAAFVGAGVVESFRLLFLGLGLSLGYALLFFLATAPGRARERAIAPHTALAMIEELAPVPGRDERSTAVPVRFVLTVAPDDAPARRVEIRQDVHVSALPDHRPRDIVVVRYPPDRPWQVRIVTRPTPEWEQRAAEARLDSAPGPALKDDADEGAAAGWLTLLGVLLGAAALLLLCRAELFGPGRESAPNASSTSTSTSSTSTSSTTTTSVSATGTATLGPGGSMLTDGQLRLTVQALTRDGGGQRALTVVAQEQTLTVVYVPEGEPVGGFALDALPCERIPDLVRRAANGLGALRSWQLTAEAVTGPLTLRIVATGDTGTAVLTADAQGNILQVVGS